MDGVTPSPSPIPQKSAPSILLILGGEDWVPDATPTGEPKGLGFKGAAPVTGGVMGGVSNGYRQDLAGMPLEPNAPPADTAAPPTGYGGLSNDVFVTRGDSWRVYTDHRQTNMYGDPAPVIASNVSWITRTPWPGLGNAYALSASAWKDYIGCCHPTQPFTCTLPSVCPFKEGTRPPVKIDNLKEYRRWSPRRGATAIADTERTRNVGDDPVIFILGGRAYSFADVDPTQKGEFIFGEKDTRHRPTWLMNDVWISTDSGETWDFNNPGCFVNDKTLTTYPGLQVNSCFTDSDCTAEKSLGPGTYCWWGPGNDYNSLTTAPGTCVCLHWSPRENHASALSQGKLYVSGGISFVSKKRCGEWICGQGMANLNSDIWSSPDSGISWALVTASMVPDDPSGRSDHAIVYANELFYLFAGRGSSETDEGVDIFYGSSFTSQAAKTWSPAPFDANVFGPRAGFRVATDGNALYMFGGAVPLGPPPPPPALSAADAVDAANAAASAAALGAAAGISPPPRIPGSGWSSAPAYAAARAQLPGELIQGLQRDVTNHFFTMFVNDVGLTQAKFPDGPPQRNFWYTDYYNPNQALQATYIHPHWPLTQQLDILNVTRADAAQLASALSIVDAAGLANIDPFSIRLCQDVNQVNVPNICLYKRAAQALVNLCRPRFRPWTSWLYAQQVAQGNWPLLQNNPDTSIIQNGWLTPNPPPDDECTNVLPIQDPYTGLTQFPGNYVCRAAPQPRRHGAMHVMDGKVYVGGGWMAPAAFAADLWVREEVPPSTIITHAPEDGGGKEKALDTTLRLACSKPTCVFEARFFKGRDASDPTALVRDWALIPSEFEVLPLSVPKEPTTLQVRAVDTAGNKDPSPLTATWTYVPPIPVGSIVLGVLGALAAIGLAYWLYRRYQRRKLLEEIARRRLARAAAERERERRKLKKVKRLKTIKQPKAVRPRAFNVFSEGQADAQNRFKELLGVRASRSRADRIGNAHDPLGAPPLTTVEAPKKEGGPGDMAGAPLTRSAKDALGFDADALSRKSAHELEKQARAFKTLMDSSSGKGGGGGVLQREGAAADFFRGGLQIHADGLAAQSAQGVTIDKIPTSLAAKVARKQARAAGKKEDDAWEISAMSKSLGSQLDKKQAESAARSGGAKKD